MRNMKGSVGIYLFIIDTLIRLNSRLGMLLFLNFCKALNGVQTYQKPTEFQLS